MRRSRALPWILVLSMLAGCAGKGAPASTTSATLPPSGDSGSIAGLVVDEEQRPVPGADVWLADDENVRAISDPGGRFSLRNVPSGERTLAAKATGFEPKQQKVTVLAGETATTTVLLVKIPVPVARTSSYIAEAIVEFGVNVLGIYYYSNRTGSDYRDLFYDVTGDAKTSVVGLRWTAVSPVSAKWMFLGVYLSDRQCIRVCDLVNSSAGRSPLVARGDGLDVRIADRGGPLTVNPYIEIRPPCVIASVTTCTNNPDAIAQVAQDQRFQLYTTIFFVDPGPPAFNPFPS